jgi:hypothetical protein
MVAIKTLAGALFAALLVLALVGCGGGGGGSSSSSSNSNAVTYSGTISFNNGTTGTISFSAIPATSTVSETIAYIFNGPNGTNNTGGSVAGVEVGGNTVVSGSTFSQNPLDNDGGTANITGTISGATITGTVTDTATSNSTTGDPSYPAFTGTYTATQDSSASAIKAQ